MIDKMLFILVAIAFIFMLLSFYWKSIILSSISMTTWFISALGCFNYEIPYVYTQGNTVIETTQSVQTMYPLGYLFVLMAIVMLLFLFDLAFEMWKGKEPKVL